MGKYFGYIFWILDFCILVNNIEGQILDVTAFNLRPLLNYQKEKTFFGGYKSSSDVDAMISLGRAVDTGTGPDWPPFPMDSSVEPEALGGKSSRVMLPAAIGLPRVGAFFVDAEKGGISHRIITITMARTAGVLPESQTLATAVGQSVTIRMTLVSPAQFSLLEWRFNGVVKPMWTSNSFVIIPSVTKEDEGIYECYDVGQREQGLQGIMRLIVQECDPGWWGPPSCDQECTVCYNGGVCDPNSGHCVCPPGFGGSNCETVFGRNSWGNDGALACSSGQDRHGDACKTRLFCRPDPYGCSCIAGYKGIDCKTECNQGTFGAGCTQECHCEGMSCLTDTGECNGVPCMSGWSGVNCQIPVPCPRGYYGDLCTERCRCANNQPCNQQNGYCSEGCQVGYIGAECVNDGSPTLALFSTQEVTNSGATSTLICAATGNPVPSAGTITITNGAGEQIPLNTTNVFGRAYKRENRYKVVVDTREEFLCLLTLSDGNTFQMPFVVNVLTPPAITDAPTISQDDITGTSVIVRWTQWSSAMPGDGPVIKYIIKYRESTTDPNAPYPFSVEVNDPGLLSKIVTGLKSDTEYDFAVAAVRPGERGEGPLSPTTSVTTMCDAPTASANITSITAYDSTVLQVSWVLPPALTWRCRSLEYVAVRWKGKSALSFIGADSSFVDVPNQGSTFITSLKPCVTYDVQTKLYTMGGLSGPYSPLASGTTGMAAPGPVVNLNGSGVTSDHRQIRLTWQLPTSNSCPVGSYQVTYQKIETIACMGSIIVTRNVTVPSMEEVFFLRDLEPYTRYRVVVSAMNMEGEGERRSIMQATVSAEPSAAPLTKVMLPGGQTKLTFSWKQIDCRKQNGPLVAYKYQLLDSNDEVMSAKQVTERQYEYNVTFMNLTPCTNYFFRVKASTDKGYGPYSAPLMAMTEIDVPGPVTMLHVPLTHITSTGITIAWQEPTSPPCPPDNYRVTIGLTKLDQCSMTTINTSLTTQYTRNMDIRASDLLPFSTYFVTVSARTMVGQGDVMATVAMTGESAPSGSPVNIIRTAKQKRSLRFQWEQPPCGLRHGNITHYSWRLDDHIGGMTKQDYVMYNPTGVAQVVISELIPFVEYEFKVRAYTSVGPGPYSDPLREQTAEAKPGPPESVTTPSADSQSIMVRWSPPDPPQGNITMYYIVYWQTGQGKHTNRSIAWTDLNRGPPYTHEIMALEPRTEYSIVIQAETIQGKGPVSDPPVTKVTEEGLPSPPLNPLAASRNQTELTISWESPKNPNGNIIKYLIMYRVIGRPYDITLPQMGDFKYLAVESRDGSIHKVMIRDLEPSTKYEVKIAASTIVGEGDYKRTEVYTAPATSIDAPSSNPVVDALAEFLDTAVAVKLVPSTSKYVMGYKIRVEKKSGTSKRDVGTYHDNPNSYIAAELDKDGIQDSFVVGDNDTYGRFYNSPLQKGVTYSIRQGSVSKSGDTDFEKWGPPLEYTAGSANQGSLDEGNSDTVSIVVGVIMGIAVVVFVVALVAFVLVKQRRRKEERMIKNEEANSVPLNNVIVNKNGNEESPKPKLKNTNSEPLKPRNMKRAQSDDALSNLDTRKSVRSQKSVVRKTASGPTTIRVEQLADYIKRKKSETIDGLKQEYATLPEGKLHPWTVAMKPENKQKNRYGNIIAYDHSRVKLEPLEGDEHSDYANACYIDGYNKKNKYIASQGPNTASINDIWRMAWQERSAKIIMVTNLNEGGKKKCEKYWPDKARMYGDIRVTLVSEENFNEYCTRTFSLQKGEETRDLTQFHFTFWPDMGVPTYAAPLLRFINSTKDFNPPKSGPTIIHCSAGVGRTGTLITLDTMLDMAKQENQVDVYNCVRNMRSRRIKMVQTPDQYVFIFDALLEALICGDTSCLTETFCTEFHRLKTRKSLAGKTLMQQQFEALQLVTVKMSSQVCRGGSDPLNVHKNRYPDRLPFDKFRPYLMTDAGEDCTNYINASFLDGYIRKNMFFATQMPLSNTVIDFWRLIFDYNSNTIVMLNAMDHNDATMSQYWPESGSTSYGPFTIELLSSDTNTDIITRTFLLTNSQRKLEKPRKVRQFQYTGWPNGQEKPNSPDTILSLYNQIERWCPQTSEDSPITVHCLDGMGVTGTFCAIFLVLDRLKTEQSVDVFQAVKKIRVTRAGMVQTMDQYIFCYETVLAYLDSMELYGNFKI